MKKIKSVYIITYISRFSRLIFVLDNYKIFIVSNSLKILKEEGFYAKTKNRKFIFKVFNDKNYKIVIGSRNNLSRNT